MSFEDLSSPVIHAMHAVRTAVHAGATAAEARVALRERRLDHHLFYVYVVDDDDRLLGQVSARRLLLCDGEEPVVELMHPSPAVASFTDTVGKAFETLANLRQLAIPVVDGEGRLLGVVDVTAFTADAAERLEQGGLEFFGRLGAAVEEHRMGGPARGFRLRMPWLLCNIASGIACAFIVEAHEALLAEAVVIASFIPLVLTVSESVGVQAAELSVGLLRADARRSAFLRRMRTELATCLMLGACAGGIVSFVSQLLSDKGEHRLVMLVLLLSVMASAMAAACIGSLVPRVVRRLRADPRFASGPVTLMLVDVATTVIYLTIAAMLFARHAAAISPAAAAP
jgi:magnesium transporter